MSRQIVFRDCPEEDKQDIRDYWSAEGRRFDRILRRIPEEQRHLRLNVRCRPGAWETRAVLLLPNGTLVANETAGSVCAALDGVSERLTQEIRKHKDLMRRDDLRRRRERRRREFAAADAFLVDQFQLNDRTAFFDYLRPLLRRLRTQAHHELVLAQLEDSIRPGELSVSDVIDEAILRAWDEFGLRPADEPLDQWLTNLLHRIIDENKGKTTAELAVGPGEADDVADGWIADNEPYWGELEPVTLEDVLPDYETSEPWQHVADNEQRRWLLRHLRRVPRRQRRAFLLSVLEGWSEMDIADLYNCRPDDIHGDIERTKAQLRETLEAEAKAAE